MHIKSLVTVAASMLLILVFVFSANLLSSTSLNAHPDAAHPPEDTTSNAGDEGEFEDEFEGDEGDQDDEGEEGDEGDQDDEGEDEEEDLEREFMELELEKLSIESNEARVAFMVSLTEIARNSDLTAGYAMMHLEEFMEEDEMIELLEQTLESDSISPARRNLIRMKLAAAYTHMDSPDKAKAILKQMLTADEK